MPKLSDSPVGKTVELPGSQAGLFQERVCRTIPKEQSPIPLRGTR